MDFVSCCLEFFLLDCLVHIVYCYFFIILMSLQNGTPFCIYSSSHKYFSCTEFYYYRTVFSVSPKTGHTFSSLSVVHIDYAIFVNRQLNTYSRWNLRDPRPVQLF